MSPHLKIENLTMKYEDRTVLNEINLEFVGGELTAIVGSNGSGKTTLLQGLSGLKQLDEGQVLLNGKNIKSISRKNLARQIAVLTQREELQLDLTVEELVWRGRHPHQSLFKQQNMKDHDAVDKAMEAANIKHFAKRRLTKLSEGERQRAWIALTLAQEPHILILDEPTNFLDLGHQVKILSLLEELNRDNGITIIVVLHDLTLAGRFAQRIIGLDNGFVAFDGAPKDVLEREILEKVFGTSMLILEEPQTGEPIPLPLLKHHENN